MDDEKDEGGRFTKQARRKAAGFLDHNHPRLAIASSIYSKPGPGKALNTAKMLIIVYVV